MTVSLLSQLAGHIPWPAWSLWLPLCGELPLAPQKLLIPFRSLLLLFISDSEHLWLLSSPYEHYCSVHPKIARPRYPIIPSPGHSKQYWQGLRALLPVPSSPPVSTPQAPDSASSRCMSWLLCSNPHILAERSLWNCQHRQRGKAGQSPQRSNQDTILSPHLAPRVPP